MARKKTGDLHSRKLTWKPKKGPIKTAVPLKGVYVGFHVSLGECSRNGKKMDTAIYYIGFRVEDLGTIVTTCSGPTPEEQFIM